MIGRSFFSAMSFLTVIPFPAALKHGRENAMFAGYPAAGLVIGALLSFLYWLAGLVFPGALASVILVAGSLGLTGAIHLDGLADCADAFYGRRDRETTLRILKDPRIGTMGGAAICLSLLARFAALTSLARPTALLALPVLCAFSRTSVLLALRLLPYVRSTGGIIGRDSTRSAGLLALAAAVTATALILLPLPGAAALLALGCFWRLSWRKVGGCTGDVLGASIEVAEIVFLAVLTAAQRLAVPAGAFYPAAALIFRGFLPGS